MKVVGIVAEYNPFHTGHLYHVEKSRKLDGLGHDCAVIAVMSGNFVQRGDIAVFPKHVRAEAACRAPRGPDLIIELPTPFACASAERFATAAVSLLENTGVVTHISFGSEAGELSNLEHLAECLDSEEFKESLKAQLGGGVLYPIAVEQVAREIVGTIADDLRTPNNILGIEYLRALKKLRSKIVPVTMKRLATDHDSDYVVDEVASASYIRNMFFTGRAYSAMRYIPEGAIEVFIREMARGIGPIGIHMIDQPFLSCIRRLDISAFEDISDVSDGLQFRIFNEAKKATTVMEAADLIKSKAYTHARIRRILMHAYLGITTRWEQVAPPYIKVLAFNETGRSLLRRMKTRSKLPIIIKPGDAKAELEPALNPEDYEVSMELLDLEAAVTDLYMIASPARHYRKAGQEYTTSPIYVE